MSNHVLLDLTASGWPERIRPTPGPVRPVLAIGVFDGVHLGHRSLLDAGRSLADRAGAPFWVLTFWPHPEAVLGRPPGGGVALLSTLEEKVGLLRQAGADEVLVLDFGPAAAALAAERFVRDALAAGLRPSAVVVGFNFTFGRGGRGTPALLRELCAACGIDVAVHPAVRVGGEVVSSSAVRAALAAGDVDRAGLLLGRPYSLAGPVEAGAGRGRGLGFATANVGLGQGLAVPASGVYVCSVAAGAAVSLSPPSSAGLPAVANVGVCPTFTAGGREEQRVRLEAHILEGTPPTYGDRVRVFFLRRLRPERRFAGPAELADQIGRDKAAALAFFGRAADGPSARG